MALRRRHGIAACVAFVLVAGACGGGNDDSSSTGQPPADETSTTTAPLAADGSPTTETTAGAAGSTSTTAASGSATTSRSRSTYKTLQRIIVDKMPNWYYHRPHTFIFGRAQIFGMKSDSDGILRLWELYAFNQ